MSTHVLIADDDAAVRAVIVSVIKSMNLQPVEASNGVDALMQIQNHGAQNFLAAVIDLSMPQMNGKELVAFIRQAAPHIVTILCSGMPELLSSKTNPSCGDFQAVIRKPFMLDGFKARFLRAIEKS